MRILLCNLATYRMKYFNVEPHLDRNSQQMKKWLIETIRVMIKLQSGYDELSQILTYII